MSNNLEYWESVKYRMENEGIDYCFESYSNWDEIKDEEFHRLRLGFLQYIKEIDEEDITSGSDDTTVTTE